ncbi:hypothetical protein C5167_015784 [Papaver somniferum]|uniref:Uncharacterized protein n=1 Tax=Papaver somniferum TaxID=3469 RepID=A0A4Y7J7Z4_PAPSO|nr:hypothetical protein C5167_015784 [Papaver somniferum]
MAWFEDQLSMTRDKKARYASESKKAYKKRQKKNRKEKARLQKFQIEEEANEIATSGSTFKLIKCFDFVSLYSCCIPIAEEVEISKLEHDPSSNSTCASISEEDLEELMTSIKKDPYLKPILEDWWSNHNDEHVFRYLNDPEVFQKFAQAMGFGVLGDNVSPVEDNASNAVAEDYTDK